MGESWLGFVGGDNSVHFFEAKIFCDYSASKMKEVLGLPTDKMLFIRTPSYSSPLEDDCKPIQSYSELILPKRSSTYQMPDYYLFARDIKDCFVRTIAVHVNLIDNENNFTIPPFYVDFNLRSETIQSIRRKIEEGLSLSVETARIETCGEELKNDSRKAPSKVILGAMKEGFILTVKLTQDAVHVISRRIAIFKEIRETETTYVKRLGELKKWQTIVEENRLMDEAKSKVVFQNVKTIEGAHSMFQNEMAQLQPEYGVLIGKLFLEFMPSLQWSSFYVREYREKERLVKALPETKKRKQFLDVGALLSCLMEPIQRLPRYGMFLKDLMKTTPKSHPDRANVERAFQQITEVAANLDKFAAGGAKEEQLVELQRELEEEIVKPGRVLIQRWTVVINGTKGCGLYLCNDRIFLVKKAMFRAKLIGQFSTKKVSLRPDGDKFYIESNAKMREATISVESQSEEEKLSQFLAKLWEIQAEEKQKEKDPYTLCWSYVPMSSSEPLSWFVKPRAVCIGDVIYVVSGESEINIFAIEQCYGDWKLAKVKTMPHYIQGVSICTDGTVLYLWSKNSLYKYDPSQDESNDLQAIRVNSVRQRKGASLVYYNDHVVVVGGKINRAYLKDAYIIDLATGEVEDITTNEMTARWHHAAVVVDDKMYVYGGSSCRNDLLSDLFCYDFKQKMWCQLDIQLGPRKRHEMLALGPLVVVVGGCGTLTCKAFTPNTKEVFDMKEFGNANASRYASVVTHDDTVYVVAGTHDANRSFSAMYMLEVPPSLRPQRTPKREFSRDDSSQIWKRAGIESVSSLDFEELRIPSEPSPIYPPSEVSDGQHVDEQPLLNEEEDVNETQVITPLQIETSKQQSGHSYLKIAIPVVLVVGAGVAIAYHFGYFHKLIHFVTNRR